MDQDYEYSSKTTYTLLTLKCLEAKACDGFCLSWKSFHPPNLFVDSLLKSFSGYSISGSSSD